MQRLPSNFSTTTNELTHFDGLSGYHWSGRTVSLGKLLMSEPVFIFKVIGISLICTVTFHCALVKSTKLVLLIRIQCRIITRIIIIIIIASPTPFASANACTCLTLGLGRDPPLHTDAKWPLHSHSMQSLPVAGHLPVLCVTLRPCCISSSNTRLFITTRCQPWAACGTSYSFLDFALGVALQSLNERLSPLPFLDKIPHVEITVFICMTVLNSFAQCKIMFSQHALCHLIASNSGNHLVSDHKIKQITKAAWAAFILKSVTNWYTVSGGPCTRHLNTGLSKVLFSWGLH